MVLDLPLESGQEKKGESDQMDAAGPAGLGEPWGSLMPTLLIIIVGIFLIKIRKSKNQILELEKGETKKNPGVATVLSCLYCGLGQLYNGQILKGILYMFFYGIFIGFAITAFSIGNYAALLSLVTLCILLWISGMINANEVARKINVQLDSLSETYRKDKQ